MPDATADAPTPAPRSKRRRKERRLPKLTVGMAGLAEMLDVSESWLWGQHSAARIPEGTLIAGRRLFSVLEIRAWIADGMRPRSEWASRQYAARESARLNKLRNR